MPRMICVRCEVALKIQRNGVALIEMFADPPRPYKIWMADQWQCPKCLIEMVSGAGQGPIAEHFQDGFEEVLSNIKVSNNVVYEYER